MASLLAGGAYNDDTSAIEVQHGCKATVYEHSDFTGWRTVLTPRLYYFSDLMTKGGWKNDQLSSMEVEVFR